MQRYKENLPRNENSRVLYGKVFAHKMMYPNSKANTGSSRTEDIISIPQKQYHKIFQNLVARSGLGVYIQVRLLC